MSKPERKRPVGRSSSRRKEIIRIDLKGIVCEGADWIHLAQDRDQWWVLVNVVMNLCVP
jgi:hypothetical protein